MSYISIHHLGSSANVPRIAAVYHVFSPSVRGTYVVEAARATGVPGSQMDPGIIPAGKILNERIEAYHARDAISATRLKVFADSPLKYWERYIARSVEAPRSWSLDIGAAFHAAMESDAEFARLVVVNTKFDSFRTNAAKEWRDEAVNAGKLVISPDEFATIQRMKLNTANHPIVKLALETGEREVTWRQRIGSAYLQCRTDVFCEQGITPPASEPTGPLILDYKSIPSLSDGAFLKNVSNYGYDLAEAFYRETVALICGLPEDAPRPDMLFVVTETERPWGCEVFRLDEDSRVLARQSLMLHLRRLKRCMTSGEWAHRPLGITTIGLPGYRVNAIKAEIESMRLLLE